MKRFLNPSFVCFVLLFTVMTVAMGSFSPAYAAATPSSKTLEETKNYETDTLKITIEQWCYHYKNTNLRFFIADVYTTRPDQLQTAFGGEEYNQKPSQTSEATSVIAARHGAVLAVNGDYYNSEKDGFYKYGLVIRNGILYRDKSTNYEMLEVMQDGSFRVLPKGSYKEGDGQNHLNEGVVQCFNFGPILVNNGEIVELPTKYKISTKDSIREPRTAIGWVDNNHYIVIVADGRRKANHWSDLGMTLQELQEVFKERGAQVAYNMDGGGSATMILNGERVNKSSGSRERNVSDIIYFVN
ncbi:MAG: phosphodiester glycosidase family protein [Clostridia bacterium]|nr:phosphodiester glycosidase family protein [Clostridia bacterium]